MTTLCTPLRRRLERATHDARNVSEIWARKALEALASRPRRRRADEHPCLCDGGHPQQARQNQVGQLFTGELPA